MPEPQVTSARPPGGPATGEPGGRPHPADPGPPITVRLDELSVGDLGNPRVDARLLRAVLLHDGRVAEWLRSRGIDADAVESAFPGSAWE